MLTYDVSIPLATKERQKDHGLVRKTMRLVQYNRFMGRDRKYCEEAPKLHSAAAVEFPYPFPVCLVSSPSPSTTAVLVIAVTTNTSINTLAAGCCKVMT
ncbi:hypothetical protein ACI65C_005913 [Semiaphis heraclei]